MKTKKPSLYFDIIFDETLRGNQTKLRKLDLVSSKSSLLVHLKNIRGAQNLMRTACGRRNEDWGALTKTIAKYVLTFDILAVINRIYEMKSNTVISISRYCFIKAQGTGY